jgi:ABC-type transport system involved in cytochrome bd biosynthesis fused ATPase/permease subunit
MTTIIDKIDAFYFRVFPTALMMIFFATIFIKLSMMQLDGLLGFGGAFVTSLFALTALMYARARAVTDATEMAIRSKIADHCMRTAFIAVMGFGITAYTFMSLSASYPPSVGNPFGSKETNDLQAIPMLFASISMFLFAVPIAVQVVVIVEGTVENMGLVLKKSKDKKVAVSNDDGPAA